MQADSGVIYGISNKTKNSAIRFGMAASRS